MYGWSVEAVLSSYAYFPGDMVFAVVTVKRVADSPAKVPALVARLAGTCRGSPAWVSLPSTLVCRDASVLALTAAGGDVVQLLSCEPTALPVSTIEEVPPHAERQYLFYAQLPMWMVPSYRGQALSFAYYVVISAVDAAGSGHAIKLPLRIVCHSRLDSLELNHTPLQVLRVSGSHRHVRLVHPDDVYGSLALDSDELRGRVALARASGEPLPSEWVSLLPLHHQQPFVASTLDLPAEFAHEASSEFFTRAHEHARVFHVATRTGTLVDWRMAHSVAFVGQNTVIAGELDFGAAAPAVRCCRAHVSMERREVVKPALLRTERQCFAALVEAKVVDYVELDTRNALRLAVRLNLPPTAVQTFVTDWLSVQWVLKFVFHYVDDGGRDGGEGAAGEGQRTLRLWGDDEPMPEDGDLLRVEWELDVPLVATLECRDALRFDESADSMTLPV